MFQNFIAFCFLLTLNLLLPFAPSYAEAPSLDIEVLKDFDIRRSHQKDGPDVSLRRLEIEAKLSLNRYIKAALEIELRHHFLRNGLRVDNETNLQEALEGAYFILTPHPSSPNALVAKIIFGKHRIAFGGYRKRNILSGKPYIRIAKKEEVIGMTIVLKTEKFFDKISMSFYENGDGDFEIARHYGVSIKAVRQIHKNLFFSFSSLWNQHEENKKDELRTELGVLYKNTSLGLQFYARGTIMREHPKYGNALAAIIGATKKLPKTWGRLGTEFSFVEDYAHLVSASWLITPFDDINLSVGPEIVYTRFHKLTEVGSQLTKEDLTVGVRVRVKTKKHFSRKKKLWTKH